MSIKFGIEIYLTCAVLFLF